MTLERTSSTCDRALVIVEGSVLFSPLLSRSTTIWSTAHLGLMLKVKRSSANSSISGAVISSVVRTRRVKSPKYFVLSKASSTARNYFNIA